MNIYLLNRTDRVGYDETAGFVIQADNIEKARQIAIKETLREFHDEEYEPDAAKALEVWLSAKISLLGTASQEIEGIMLTDFRAG